MSLKLSCALCASLLALTLTVAANAAEPIWDGNKVQMRSQQLAPGAYALLPADAAEVNAKGGAAATSAGLIVGTRGALLIETMLNRRLHDQVRELVEEKAAGLPLLYAVNTSSHGDHSFGNMFLPRDTRLVQHEQTARFIATHLEQDKAFMLQHFGKGRGIEPIRAREPDILVPASGKLVLDLGGRQVEIHDFGFAQTGGLDLIEVQLRERARQDAGVDRSTQRQRTFCQPLGAALGVGLELEVPRCPPPEAHGLGDLASLLDLGPRRRAP